MKCEICQEEAVFQLSPDMDINGLGACEKHKEKVKMAYYILINLGEEAFRDYINSEKKNEASGKTTTLH
jgi:hypothetical protein